VCFLLRFVLFFSLDREKLARDAKEKSCTDLFVHTPQHSILAHTEDIPLKNSRNFCWLPTFSVDSQPTYTAFCYPGCLPGNAFSWNEYGIIITVNYLLPRQLDLGGASIPFLCRDLVTSRSIPELIAKIPARRASGVSLNVASINENRMVNIELSKDEFSVKEITGEYYHVNAYKRLKALQVERPSSIHRQTRIEQFPNLVSNINTILGDTKDQVYPIYRTVTAIDQNETGATAIFDLKKKTASIYITNPSTSQPFHVFNLQTAPNQK